MQTAIGTAPVPTQPPPTIRNSHVVDGHGVGWIAGHNSRYFHPDSQLRARMGLPQTATLDHLTASRGPVRHVVAAPAGDRDYLLRLLVAATGGRALATLAAGLNDAAEATRADLGAGNPDSPDTRTLRRLTELGAAVTDLRCLPSSRTAIRDVVVSWVTQPTQFVEVASTLTRVLGVAADHLGGWPAMADHGFATCGIALHLRHYCTQHSTRYPSTAGRWW